jgi:hypothetical protein
MTSDEEENAVRILGDEIGYGRVMQLAEQEWRKRAKAQGLEGSEHTTGPCATFMMRCPHPELDDNGHCEWCCGSGRVTKRVRELMYPYLP